MKTIYRYTAISPISPAMPESQPLEIIQPQQAENERAFLFTTAAGVLLPVLQAIITGALAGLAAWCYAWLLHFPQAWRWGLGVALGVLVLAWLGMLARWLDLTRPIERLTGVDLDHDGYIGTPDTIRVEVTSQDKRHVTAAEIPYASKLADFARGVLSGEPISERQWSGAGKLFSQTEFRQVRDLFMARGWFRWINPESPQQGFEITPGGRAALRALAQGGPSPTLGWD